LKDNSSQTMQIAYSPTELRPKSTGRLSARRDCTLRLGKSGYMAMPRQYRGKRMGRPIPVRDADSIGEKMQWCLDRRPELVEISARASESAAKWQWRDYRAALGKALAQLRRRE